ncbi:MAG: histidinol-phosphate transaminase [Alphaproteobacteria bacterium]
MKSKNFMANNMALRPNSWVMDIPDYTPGKHKGAGAGPVVILSANENPYGASPYIAKLKTKPYHRYPDSQAVALRQALASFYQVPATSISCGAGSDEVLQSIAKSFLSPEKSAIYSQYGFLVYPIAIKSMGARAVVVPEKKLPDGNFITDLDAILSLVDETTAVIFLANPNNPTGTMLSLAAIKAFLDKLPPFVLLVLDVAYAEYVTADGDYSQAVMRLPDTYPNLLVVRTFSKIYGLASLRLGFCVGEQAVIKIVNKLCNVFNTSQIAQDAGVQALIDQAFVASSCDRNQKEKMRLQGVLQQAGFKFYDSQTNFYLLEFADVATNNDFINFMENHNVFLRNMKSYHLPNRVRITIGSKEENDIFLQWAHEWIKRQN